MITSTANQKVKRLAVLQKKRRARDEEGILLTEGVRMFREIPPGRIREICVTEEFLSRERDLVERKAGEAGVRPEVFSDHVFAYVSDTKTPQGVLCVADRGREAGPEEMFKAGPDGRAPLLKVLDGLQDPGNLGTILRTGEGAGVTARDPEPGLRGSLQSEDDPLHHGLHFPDALPVRGRSDGSAGTD